MKLGTILARAAHAGAGRKGIVFAAAAAALWSAPPARGVISTWSFNGSGNWSLASNWNNGVPGANYDVGIQQNDAITRTVTYDYTGPAITLTSLTINNTGTGVNTVSQAANSLSVGFEWLGSPSTAGGSGNLALSGGTHTVTTQLVCGYVGNGNLSVSGGSLSVTGNSNSALMVGSNSLSNGTVTLSGTGAINMTNGNEILGNAGNGTINQSGGTHTFRNLTIGNNPTGVGNYNLTGGVASGTTIYCGFSGSGNIFQGGGRPR